MRFWQGSWKGQEIVEAAGCWSTGPKCQGRLHSRTKICSDGSVKGRAGLLKGVTSLGFAYCDKQTKQTVYCKSLPSCSSSSSSYYYYYATTLSISLSLSLSLARHLISDQRLPTSQVSSEWQGSQEQRKNEEGVCFQPDCAEVQDLGLRVLGARV